MTLQLATDNRGRVPFALLGVLLLVSSVMITTVTPSAPSIEQDAASALDRGTAISETVLRDATQTAGAQAAAQPVIDPGGFGAVLNVDRPFRSYLELLVYRNTQQRLAGTSEQIGDQRVVLALPEITDHETARAAIDRTTVRAVGNGSVRVQLQGITMTVYGEQGAIATEDQSLNLTVATPVLTMHDQMMAFESRLNRGPIQGPGLGRGLTGHLYAMGWARGYAQYSGAPIDDVIGHRHVELATASSVLDQQQAAFGTTDPDTSDGLARATARTAAQDILPADLNGVAAAGLPKPNNGVTGIETPDGAIKTDTVTVGGAADRAFESLLEEDRSLEAIVSDAHDLEGTLTVETRRPSVKLRAKEPHPGQNWTRVQTDERIKIKTVQPFDVRGPEKRAGWQRLTEIGRVIEADRIVRETWTNGTANQHRVKRYEEEYTVGIGIDVRQSGGKIAPDRPVDDLGTTGDPPTEVTSGSVADTVTTTLVAEYGGIDEMATTAVKTDISPDPQPVTIDPPQEVQRWVYEDLASLRDELKGLSIEIDRLDATTGTPPAQRLHAEIQDRRGTIINAPGRYQNRPHKALIAARTAYVDALLAELKTDSQDSAAVQNAFLGQLNRATTGLQGSIEEIAMTGSTYMRPDPAPPTADPPAENFSLSVETVPGYPTKDRLTTTDRKGALEEPAYPLGIRITTVAAPPVDKLTDPVVERLFIDDTVGLPRAARALKAVNQVPSSLRTEQFEKQQAVLEAEVKAGLAPVEKATAQTLAERTTLSAEQRQHAIDQGFTHWNAPATQVQAIEDGQTAEAVAAAAVDDRQRQDRLATRLRVTMREALTDADASVPNGPVTECVDTARMLTKEVTADAAEEGTDMLLKRLDERFDNRLSMVPAGVPLLPKPGAWWLTANGWAVEIEGEYPAIVLNAPHGSPASGGQTTYLRDGQPVTVDVTGNGTPERLGTSTRVRFETQTVVIVAVPPGKNGVGNTDSDAIDCSAGWTGDCIPG